MHHTEIYIFYEYEVQTVSLPKKKVVTFCMRQFIIAYNLDNWFTAIIGSVPIVITVGFPIVTIDSATIYAKILMSIGSL